MLALKQVTARRGETDVLRSASLRINPGTCTAIVGKAASGKSVLIDLLLGVQAPESGAVEIDGIDIKVLPRPVLQLFRRRVGVVWQLPHLIPYLSLRENVRIPLELAGATQAIITRNVNDLLERLGLGELADAMPAKLSLGQKMCATVARAVCASPYILIADEPFALLDDDQQSAVRGIFAALMKHGTTMILLTQHEQTATGFKPRIVRLDNGAFKEKSAAAAVSMDSRPSPHRILEEINRAVVGAIQQDLKLQSQPEKKRSKLPVRSANGSGKKIRITAIGSGL